MEELIKRLEQVIQTGVPDKNGQHPISAEVVLEVVRGLSELGTNLAAVGTDCISRQDALEAFGLSEKTRKYGGDHSGYGTMMMYEIQDTIENLPPIQSKIVRCKDCKHFEYDHPYIIQGIPVLGHEVCNAWGDGCKTDENGYCFMAERRTDE